MRNTGERYLPDLDAARISYEHWHRYLLAGRFVAGRAVLDVAAGEGYGAALLARTAATVVGVDLSAEAVAHARAKYRRDNLTFREGAAESIPIPGEHVFDVITSFETLEHLSGEGQVRFLAEVRRLLRPGGRLLVSTPNRVVYSDRGEFHNPFHLHEFDPAEFAAFLGRAFPEVRILAQHVYTGSYMWDADPGTAFTEFQIGLRDGEYRPLDQDEKDTMYLVGVCSDAAIEVLGKTFLLDADAAGASPDESHGRIATLFSDTGSGFHAAESVSVRMPPGPGEFRLTYDVGATVRGVRWDPLELRSCRVRLDAVEWNGADGRSHRVDPAAAGSNGTAGADGTIAFDTIDPMIYLPVAGAVATLTVSGWFEADDASGTLVRVGAATARAHAHAADLAEQLRSRDDELRTVDGQVRTLCEQVRSLTAALDAAREASRTSTLYVDTGDGFRAEDRRSQTLPQTPGPFQQTFLVGTAAVRRVRWDSGLPCGSGVVIHALEWSDPAGRCHRLPPDAGEWATGPGNPHVIFPVAGNVSRVTVSGWQGADAGTAAPSGHGGRAETMIAPQTPGRQPIG